MIAFSPLLWCLLIFQCTFPLMSTLKTLACAKLLTDVDQQKQQLSTESMIEKALLVTYSPVTEPRERGNNSIK